MSFYEKNKKHLSFYSDLFEKLDKIPDTKIEYEFVQAKNQTLTLKYKNVFLYSADHDASVDYSRDVSMKQKGLNPV